MPVFVFVLLIFLPSFAAAQEMTFRLAGNGGNCDECEWVAAQGEITAATPDAFAAFMANHRTRHVVLDSPGGDLGSALRLGRLMREQGKFTGVGRTVPNDFGSHQVIEGRCDSACAFAFMGGEARRIDVQGANRFVPYLGKLGMHRFYTREGAEIPSAATQQIMGQLLIFVQDMGIDPRVLSLASTASADNMYYFSPREMAEFRLVTTASVAGFEPVLLPGGLAVQSEARGQAGQVERVIALHCDLALSRWILTVTSLGAAAVWSGQPAADTSGAFEPFQEDAEFMLNELKLRLGDAEMPLQLSDVLATESNGRDHRLRVQLPVDLRNYAGQDFRFVTSRIRMAIPKYLAAGTLPDANSFSVLSRTCLGG